MIVYFSFFVRSVTYLSPTAFPVTTLIIYGTQTPTQVPTATSTYGAPTVRPTHSPSVRPTALISNTNSSSLPSSQPSDQPASSPISQPSSQPTTEPSNQPNRSPTSAPTLKAETWGEVVTDYRRRGRTGGLCDNHCSHHGTCEMNSNCNCFVGLDGEPEWTGPDCSLRTCPKDFAWVGSVVGANGRHTGHTLLLKR